MNNIIPPVFPSHQQCIECKGDPQPLSNFYENPYRRVDGTIYIGYRPKCKECMKKARREAHARCNTQRAPWLKRAYNLSESDYESMWQVQDGKCDACHRHEKDVQEPNLPYRRLVVDHCHKTGIVRGLLCGPCNRLYGAMGENPERIRGLLAYAERWHEWPEGGRLL